MLLWRLPSGLRIHSAVQGISGVMVSILCIGVLSSGVAVFVLYQCREIESFKNSVMIGIAFMGFSISLAVMKLPFIPVRLNVISWWMVITGIMEYFISNAMSMVIFDFKEVLL